ncbi:MAG: YqjK family protein [Polaromonas sp.]|nr:YqjK family protein [Polaromonas sp.]
MNRILTDLYQQRGQLRERIASQRATLAWQLVPLQNASDAGSRVVAMLRRGVQTLKSNPLPVALAVLALVVLKPRRAWRWAGKGLFLWRSWRALRAWLPASLLGESL